MQAFSAIIGGNGLWLAIPALYLGTAALISQCRTIERSWQLTGITSLATLTLALAFAVGAWLTTPEPSATLAAGTACLVLIAFLGWVILRFSRSYLAGESCQQRFLGGVFITLAGATLVSITDHLGMLALAWSATSLGLHRLLTLYPQRPGAQLAADKHFLAARLADVSLVAAVLLIARETGTLSLTTLGTLPATLDTNTSLAIAAVLLALAAIIRCAQLPVHGWLIQVMEAPTPVSALLHAGVVNLGGLVLIKTAWLLDMSAAAQWLLLIVGGITTVLAALATIAQTSIKVRLAWSTSAQMGFMLVECALGAWHLALLHLLGHSLYKAHAFLGAGTRVNRARRAALLPKSSDATSAPWLAVPLTLAAALPVLFLSGAADGADPVFLLVTLVAVTPLLSITGSSHGRVRALLMTCGIVALTLAWHWLFQPLTGAPDRNATPLQACWVALLFTALLVAQKRALSPAGRSARAWRARFAAGFQLDEAFTTFCLWLWPRRSRRRSRTDVFLPWQQEETST